MPSPPLSQGQVAGAATVTTPGNTYQPTPFYDASGVSFLQRINGVLSTNNDGSGVLTGVGTALPFVAPVPAWNSLFWFHSMDVDGQGNASTTQARKITVTAADNVVAATQTWVWANGVFKPSDIGGSLLVNGATNGGNSGTFPITSVSANGTTVVTSGAGTLVNETFSTPGNLTVEVVPLPGSVITDQGLVSTWFNKGTFQTAGARVDATRSVGNLSFRKQYASGRAGNFSSVHSDGTGLMSTAAIAALATPVTIGVVFALDTLAPVGGHQGLVDGQVAGGRSGFFVDAATGIVSMVGSGTAATTATVGSSQICSLVGVFNGASSSASVNGGASTPNVNPSPTAMTAVSLFSLVGGAFPMTGDLFEVIVTVDPLATPALMHSYFAAGWGAMPQ